jgi:signal transduction histidine kinase
MGPAQPIARPLARRLGAVVRGGPPGDLAPARDGGPATGTSESTLSSPSGLGLALATIGVCVAALATLQLALVIAADPAGVSHGTVALPTVVGVVYAGAGLIAWARRPHNRMGPLLAAAGLAWFGWGLWAAEIPVLVAVSLLCGALPLAIMVHLLLAFPSGRLEHRSERTLVAVGYLLIPLVHVPTELLGASRDDGIGVLDVVHDTVVADVARSVQTAADGMVLAAAAVFVLRRLRAGDPGWRRLAAPLYLSGIAALAFVALLGLLRGAGFTTTGGWPADLLDAIGIAVVVLLPLAFLTAMLRGGFARAGELGELVRRLSDAPLGQAPLAAAVADALGDPTATLAYWLPEELRYVDASGSPLEPDSRRGVEEVTHDGRRVGAIVYDGALLRDAEPVRSVARMVSLALERERLAAELRASARELRASRARLAEAADDERRRIARDLHDGAQQRLVLLAIESERLARRANEPMVVRQAAGELRAGLDAALADIRGLVQGIVPPLLAERGLCTAVEELAAQAPLPVTLDLDAGELDAPEHVESTAYFVVTEALVNIAKHARATRATVSLRHHDGVLEIEVSDDGVGGADRARGSGIDGLADRVAAVGGKLALESEPGAGTRLHVELPCAS